MKLVLAVIKPQRLEDVKVALRELDVSGMTTVDAQGFGRQRGQTELYRGGEYRVDFVPKVEVQVIAQDDQVDAIVQAIVEAARTGKIGDGKVWVLPVEQAHRIRTGETGAEAV